MICPRCKNDKDMKYPAISRRDNKTKICSDCGTAEAMFDFAVNQARQDSKKFEERHIEKSIENEKEWLTRRKENAIGKE